MNLHRGPVPELDLSGEWASHYEFVPLGSNCDVSHFFRSKGVRRIAYPFDWNVTPLATVRRLLETEFSSYMEEDDMVYLEPVPRLLFEEGETMDLRISEEYVTPAVCRRHHVLFPHDFPREGKAQWRNVRDKYMRRIGRFKGVLRGMPGRIPVFVVVNAPLNAWQEEQYRRADLPVPDTSAAGFMEELSGLRVLLAEKMRASQLLFTLPEVQDMFVRREAGSGGLLGRVSSFLKRKEGYADGL